MGFLFSVESEEEENPTPPRLRPLPLLDVLIWLSEQFCSDLSKDAVIVAMFGAVIFGNQPQNLV